MSYQEESFKHECLKKCSIEISFFSSGKHKYLYQKGMRELNTYFGLTQHKIFEIMHNFMIHFIKQNIILIKTSLAWHIIRESIYSTHTYLKLREHIDINIIVVKTQCILKH